MPQTISTKKHPIPAGYRKIRFDRAGYKTTILGKEVLSDVPVWAEYRYDKNAIFAEDKKYVVLFTYTKIQVPS